LPHFLTLTRPTLFQKFRLINRHEAILRSNPSAILSHPLAISRNRYPDIHPWSHNRIHLAELEFPYINASPIDLGRENERFIATQGPVGTYRDGDFGGRVVQGEGGNGVEWSGTGKGSGGGFGHFWEMVWQEGVEVIVMLTRCVEEGREKCGVYYPSAVGEVLELEGDSNMQGNWGSVKCETLNMEGGTEVRELALSKRKKPAKKEPMEGEAADERVSAESRDEGEMEEKKVWHFLFLGWPDQEVPQTPEDQKALLELIRMTRFRINAVIDHKTQPQLHLQKQAQTTPPSSSSSLPLSTTPHKPRIVHCSAGVGRTGTFIALDFLLQELDEGKFDDLAGKVEDPVFECVKRLREQRMLMVYKAGQYAFIYQVLRERWLARWEMKNGGGGGEEGSPTKKRKFLRDAGSEGKDGEGEDPFR
jgi:protein-tyrosine phosphatase